MKVNKNIALISLYTAENYGVRILAALLRRNGYRVIEVYFKDWKNNFLEYPRQIEITNLLKILQENNVSLVGISVRTSGFMDIAILITEQIKQKLGVTVIWGGMHPTSMPEECIKAADFICIGEAEDAFLEFVDKFFNNQRINNISNIWARERKTVFRNPPRSLISDLDSIPFRDFANRDKFFINRKAVIQGDPCLKDRLYLINTSRGCLFNCSFCIIPLLNKLYQDYGGYSYRFRSVKNVIRELVEAKETFPKLRRVRFDDELFTVNKQWVKIFSKEYKKHIALPFDILIHPLFVDRENLLLLKEAGLDTVLVGVQNTERINRVLYNRNQSNSHVIKIARVINSLKLNACYQLIVDDPISTIRDKRDLFEFIASFPRPYNLYLFSLTIYPNTPLAIKLMEEGYIEYDEQFMLIKKIFYQYRVDLAFDRPNEDIFWISLLVLISKNFIPIKLLKGLSKSNYLRKHPFVIKWVAQGVNVIKLSFDLLVLVLRDDIDIRTIKRWLNLKSLITQ